VDARAKAAIDPLEDMEHALLLRRTPSTRITTQGAPMKRTLTTRTALIVLALVPLACSSPKERARQKLGEMNITYDQDTFVERAKAGDAIVVAQFIAAGMNPNAMNKEGKTALMAAAETGRPAMVQFLLDKGAAVDVRDAKFRATPLIWAGLANNSQVTKLLLEHGADPKARESQGGTTALQAAAGRGNLEAVQLLLAKGAQINDRDKQARTPSMLAAARGRANVVKALADKGADLKTVDREGNTALMWAAKSGNAETIKVLLEKGADVNTVNIAGLTALSIARSGNRAEIESLLVKAGAHETESSAKKSVSDSQPAKRSR
jgi:ankyrin repeat protein